MTGTDTALVITALASLVSAVLSGVATVYAAIARARADAAAKGVATVQQHVATIESHTNGLVRQLVRAEGAAGHAAGVAEERERGERAADGSAAPKK